MSDHDSPEQRRFAFLLLENFSMISLAGAMDPLRLANRNAGFDHYCWMLLSEDGLPVRCSNLTVVNVDSQLIPLAHRDTIVVCGGTGVRQASTPRIINWLRRESMKGIAVIGMCTGAYTMAKAGLLNHRRATIHWQNRDSLREEFPDTELCKSVYTVDGKRMTTAGGVSSIDLMLQIISGEQGEDAANMVAEHLIYSAMRTEQDEQGPFAVQRVGEIHPKLISVIRMMEDNIEEPISPAMLARQQGMSLRQLERLFRRYLNRSPKRYYVEIRLQRARNLLLQTEMTVLDVAIACGFGTSAHFSKCYRMRFNSTPYRERGRHPEAESSTEFAGVMR